MVRSNKFRLKIEHLWGLTALIGIFVFINTHPIRPNDFWWHMAIGRDMLSTGNIPTVDVYSYTEAGQPYPSYQMFWLMEVSLYEIYKLGGLALVIFLYSITVTAAYLIIYWLGKQTSHSWRIAAFGVIFAAAMGLNDWNVRPQGITFLLAGLFLLAIHRYNEKSSWYWLIIFPLGMVIWVNSHGTFLIGLGLIGIWWAQRIWDTFFPRKKHHQIVDKKSMVIPGIILLITTLACLVNPRGVGIIDYVKTLTSNTAVQNLVTEWAPPTLNTLMGAIFIIGLMGSTIVLALSPNRPSLSQAVSFIVFGMLGLKTSRGIVWFGIVMAPILCAHMAAIISNLSNTGQKPVVREGSRIVNYLFAILLIMMGLISLPWFKSILPLPAVKKGLVSTETPIKATEFLLERKPPGELFNAMSFGSYLIWAAYPQYQVFVDSRIELFSLDVWMDYLNISNTNGDWEAKLDGYGVNTLMLSPEEQPILTEAVQLSDEWNLLYDAPNAMIFVRR